MNLDFVKIATFAPEVKVCDVDFNLESVKNGIDTPIDVYDTLTWLAIGPLSEQSISLGGAPVSMPDFTYGKWLDREPVVKSKYCLDEVIEDSETSIF